MLTRMPLNAGQVNISELVMRDLILDADYQRASVWGRQRQRNLVKSLMLGIPVGNIYLNYRPDTHNDAVVDGKQRIEAILAFLDSELDVPADWFDPADVPTGAVTVLYRDLSKRGQGQFTRCSLTVQQTEINPADEVDLFDLINFGGIAQGQTEETS